ncbi:MAG: hypothetical protein ACOCQ5_06265 [Halanaerobiales bacterium]
MKDRLKMFPNINFTDKTKLLIKNIFLDILLIIGILLVIFGGYILYQEQIKSEVTADKNYNITYDQDRLNLDYVSIEEDQEYIEIEIPEGVSSFTVAQILGENDLIEEEDFLKLVDMFSLEKRIKAGTYTFSEEASFTEIIETIM